MRVSVVVPARNEAESLPALLESLLQQSRPPDEILVVDAGSTDRTADVARGLARPDLRVLRIDPAYPGRARNAGIAAATNDWVALVDAGCVADRDWLSTLVAPVGSGAAPAVVFGHYEPHLSNEWDVAQALVTVPPRDPATRGRPPSTASMLIHRSIWRAVGPFREDLRAAEDLIFFRDLAIAGHVTHHAPGAVVRWSLALGPLGFFRRLLRYSAAHLDAGLYRTWHFRVATMDVAFALSILGGMKWPPLAGLAVALALARLVRTIATRRGNIAPRFPASPAGVARVGLLLLLSDLAVWGGLLGRLWPRTQL